MKELASKLKDWRLRVSIIEGVPLFKVLSNSAIDEIARLKPKTKTELLAIKGIKEKKFGRYGSELLSIVNDQNLFDVPVSRGKVILPSAEILGRKSSEAKLAMDSPEAFSVSDYLDLINVALGDFKSRVIGEVSSFEDRGNVIYFNLKDKKDGSVLSCLIWQSDYGLCGVAIEQGMEVIVSGVPNVFKPIGRMSFKAVSIELVGEGSLKKAYDELKKKLEKEGLFAAAKKRALPEFPEKIGLITSKTGAVINDFLNNIGKFGYKISFFDSRVEGQLAVADLLKAVEYFKDKDIDVLVVIRGGGSFESLLAFNNETLVREIAEFPKPVIAGIGHDKDVPLFALAADIAVSTPTAVTRELDSNWEKVVQTLHASERDILNFFEMGILRKREAVESAFEKISERFGSLLDLFREAERKIVIATDKIGYSIKHSFDWVERMEKFLQASSPERQLGLGYSIVYSAGALVKGVQGIRVGDIIDVRVSNGEISSAVKKIKKDA